MRTLIGALVVSLLTCTAQLSASEFFEIRKVADGVYAAIGKPGILSNGAFIVTEEAVIVVDTHLRPSWARDLIAEIRTITDKPVRYVINTHWHNDHTQGNQAYRGAFPAGTEFIAHHMTRADIIGKAIPSMKQNLADLPSRISRLRTQIQSRKKSDGAALSEDELAQAQLSVESLERYYAELQSLEITLPSLTFEKSASIHSGSRRIDLLFFGEGHTRGDIFVYVADAKVLISGDMLTGGVPFMRDAIPSAWGPTLEAVAKLDFTTVLPGHGDVQTGKDRIHLVTRYLRDLGAAVRNHAGRGASLEETTNAVLRELAAYEKDFPNFKQSLTGPTGNITKMFEELKNQK